MNQGLVATASLSSDLRWEGVVPTVDGPVLVVAPHPDDEVLAAAGILVWLEQLGVPTTIIAVTDGESSHSGSRQITPVELRARRTREREEALSRLGLSTPVERLSLPDGSVRDHEASLAAALSDRSSPGCTIVAPWSEDQHPDHEAVGRAAALAAPRTQAHLWTVPIWSKVRAPHAFDAAGARRPGRLWLSARFQALKRDALDCHTSQVTALGPTDDDGPVIHPHEVVALLDGVEEVRWM